MVKICNILRNRHVRVSSKRNKRLTCPESTTKVDGTDNQNISMPNIVRRLHLSGLKRTLATKNHNLGLFIEKRFQWTMKHKYWTEIYLNNVPWTDESTLSFLIKKENFCEKKIRRKISPECNKETDKH